MRSTLGESITLFGVISPEKPNDTISGSKRSFNLLIPGLSIYYARPWQAYPNDNQIFKSCLIRYACSASPKILVSTSEMNIAS